MFVKNDFQKIATTGIHTWYLYFPRVFSDLRLIFVFFKHGDRLMRQKKMDVHITKNMDIRMIDVILPAQITA